MHDGSAITPTTLVALPQPQQGNDLLSGKVALGQGVDVRLQTSTLPDPQQRKLFVLTAGYPPLLQ